MRSTKNVYLTKTFFTRGPNVRLYSIFPTHCNHAPRFFLNILLGYKSKKNEVSLKSKEEHYSKLLIKLQGFVESTANSQTKKEFFEEQYKSWLYCSDEVVKSINAMVSLVINEYGKAPNPEEGRKAIGNIVLAMRKDLNEKTKLNYEDFRYTDVN